MQNPSQTMFTIGYEGSAVEDLVQTLVNLEIQVLADVRELPLSRKRGFSKRSLSEHLYAAGIEYVHFRALGDPKPGRDAAKAGDHERFVQIFKAHLDQPNSQDALRQLLSLAARKVTCLLCFERCPSVCHRSFLADAALDAGFDVYNLVANRPEKYLENGCVIPRHYYRQGLTAAE